METKTAKPSENQESSPFQVCGRIWVEGPGGTFLGYGRAVLLSRIREYGSLSAAARSMKISYRHAWELLDSMNRQSATPLVISSRGGKGGGGARLTPAGETAVTAFFRLYQEMKTFLAGKNGRLADLVGEAEGWE